MIREPHGSSELVHEKPVVSNCDAFDDLSSANDRLSLFFIVFLINCLVYKTSVNKINFPSQCPSS